MLNQGGQQLLLGDSEEDKTPLQSSGSSTNSGRLRVPHAKMCYHKACHV